MHLFFERVISLISRNFSDPGFGISRFFQKKKRFPGFGSSRLTGIPRFPVKYWEFCESGIRDFPFYTNKSFLGIWEIKIHRNPGIRREFLGILWIRDLGVPVFYRKEFPRISEIKIDRDRRISRELLGT